MITERMFEKGEDKSMEEYFVERAWSYMRYQVFPGEGTPILFIKDRVRALILAEANLDLSKEGATSYEITRVSEKDFMKTSYQLLLETCKKSGNTMWAATLTNWEPYAALYRFSESALRGGNLSWRQCLYRLPIKKASFMEKSHCRIKIGKNWKAGGFIWKLWPGLVILWPGKIRMGWQWQLQIA